MNINTIKLLRGEDRVENKKYKDFVKGDTIWGADSEPEELKRWSIEDKEQAKEELAKYRCFYDSNGWGTLVIVEEFALEYCECDEEGEFVEGSNFELAEERESDMKTTLQLLDEVEAMGFDREKALEDIDVCLDEMFGYENRKYLEEEYLTDKLYNELLFGFQCELDEI